MNDAVKTQPGTPAAGGQVKPGQDKPKADKAEGAKTDRARTSKQFGDGVKIKLLADKNPKREGSKAHSRFALYKKEMTVGEFIKAGGTFGDLAWDASRGYIQVEGYAPKMVEKKAKPEKKEGDKAAAPAPTAGAKAAAPAPTVTK